MLFTSPVFLFLFLPVVYVLHRLVHKNIFLSNLLLLATSSFFYYYGEQEKILIMYFVIILNWLTGWYVYSGTHDDNTYIEKTPMQKFALFGCIVVCIGLLWYYKYLNFSIAIFNDLFNPNQHLEYIKGIVLPLGISFYTFHVLSYTLDVYFGRLKVEKNFFNFASYVFMFPQLIAGPIVRYIDIKHQFYHRNMTLLGTINGLRIFFYGFAKKVLLANTISVYVDDVFSKNINDLTPLDCWLGGIGYSLQIYFDFSGYSSMAIGLAMLFGFRYKDNFNFPYIAKSASEFWHRWHISLSTWLRDYVYINIGGNRVASWRKHFNVIFVFFCSGLWHGANTTFVCWGLLYGICIMLENMGWKKVIHKFSTIGHIYLLLVAITGWVMFRSDSMTYAGEYIKKMYLVDFTQMHCSVVIENNIIFAMLLGVILSYDWRNLYKKVCMYFAVKFNKRSEVFMAHRVAAFMVSTILFVISIASVISSSHNPFIYFRF